MSELRQSNKDLPPFQTFQVPLDHFNASDNEEFTMRYLVNISHVAENDTSPPILFYAGNEGPVEQFWENSGFLTNNLSATLKGAVLFAEHRYYGDSMPFDNKKMAYEKENLRFLSVEQVMQDYVKLIEYFKKMNGYNNSKVYAFGGSYGGMLAAWLRMKYPTHFHGAIASSAPIRWFKGATDPNDFSRVVSNVIKQVSGEQCYNTFYNGFYDLTNIVHDSSRWPKLKEIFNTC